MPTEPVTVAPARLEELVRELFAASGVPEGESEEISRHLVLANLGGVDSHRVGRVAFYVERLELGLVSPVTRVETLRETPMRALLDGGNGSGLVVAARAMRTAIQKAEESGIGMVCVRGSNHCGMLARYTDQAAGRGLIGPAATSAPATMAPWGSRQTVLRHEPALICDTDARGRRRHRLRYGDESGRARQDHPRRKEGRQIPLGWALDPESKPTESAEKALEGTMLLLGGPKGSGLALLVEIPSATLSSVAYGPHIPPLYDNPDREPELGHFFLAFRPDLFVEPHEFAERGSGMSRELRALPLATGHEQVYLPGEPEAETERERSEKGVPLSPAVLEELADLAGRLGVASSLAG